jgi:hypothetical protein
MTVIDQWTCVHTRQVDQERLPYYICNFGIATVDVRTVESGPTGGTEEDVYRRQTPPTTELRNPDHASGGSTPFWWVNEREKGTFDFSKVGSGGKSPGAMPDAPHTEDGTPTSQRVVSQNDLLERYDEDSRNRAGGAALSQQDLCAHSEC